MEVTYSVIVEDTGDDPTPTMVAMPNAISQLAAWAFARGVRWTIKEWVGASANVYVVTNLNGAEVERIKVVI